MNVPRQQVFFIQIFYDFIGLNENQRFCRDACLGVLQEYQQVFVKIMMKLNRSLHGTGSIQQMGILSLTLKISMFH